MYEKDIINYVSYFGKSYTNTSNDNCSRSFIRNWSFGSSIPRSKLAANRYVYCAIYTRNISRDSHRLQH